MKNLKSKVQNHSEKFKRKSGIDRLEGFGYFVHRQIVKRTCQLKASSKKLKSIDFHKIRDTNCLAGIGGLGYFMTLEKDHMKYSHNLQSFLGVRRGVIL